MTLCAGCLQDGMLQLHAGVVGPVLLILANNWQAWWSYVHGNASPELQHGLGNLLG